MLEQNEGAIVNVSSLAGLGAIEAIPVSYTASKYAVVGITKQLAVNYAKNNIRVNAVCPGLIGTKFHDDFTKDEVRTKVAANTPLKREGSPEEVADVVAYLASEEASFITGNNIDINGGLAFS